MISTDEAKFILKTQGSAKRAEEIPLLAATGLVLACDIFAVCEVPVFDNAAMDGYALKFIPGKISYTVIDTIAAGNKPTKALDPGEAVRIFTGAPLPEGADTVVQQEVCTRSENRIIIDPEYFSPGTHIRRRGSQNKKGQRILAKGTLITGQMIPLLASAGIKQVKIYTPPSVAVIITGSEIAANDAEINEYTIHDANGPGLQAALNKLNITRVKLFYTADNEQDIQKTIRNALRQYDMLILSGGVSAGDYDFVKTALDHEGVTRLIYKIAQKPGKPFFAGKKSDKWVFALPGNPAAALTCFTLYVDPVIRMINGQDTALDNFRLMPLSSAYSKKAGLTHFLKAKAGHLTVSILNGQDSFDLSPYSEANAYVELSSEREKYLAGDLVKVYNI
ncbi:MAG: molybdenum cofactor synthesis domain protein [Bacteroidetes bacterium]|jgi:molybdopterin molybdotransferase|nr:molybdenum cofactor synthesis domain protein [Bacteroidota bacterium]